jgi:hypothetical protein
MRHHDNRGDNIFIQHAEKRPTAAETSELRKKAAARQRPNRHDIENISHHSPFSFSSGAGGEAAHAAGKEGDQIRKHELISPYGASIRKANEQIPAGLRRRP